MELFKNDPLIAGVVAWFVAQIIKMAIILSQREKVTLSQLFASGGMPSSHSSCVCALTTCLRVEYGINSPLFAIAAVFSFIVMYDAIGVRRETGEQSKVLNRLAHNVFVERKIKLIEKDLKELIGHTPIQVFFGLLLGITIGLLYPYLLGHWMLYAA